ncbi:MAG: acyltransferase [Candidatus Hodarchaeales archaeon]|jgi:acetyltransferase-like isoleucine patch superfamily enzyme
MSESYYVHPTAIIDQGAIIGENTKIWHFVHIRDTSKIGKNTILGKNVYVDVNVEIGSNCKIQNNVSIYNGVTIEDAVFVGPHVVFTNDLKPRAEGTWKISKTSVKNGVSIGTNSVIICGITLGTYCMIGAGSVVTKTVPAFALVFGNPARFQGVVCKCGDKIAGKEAVKGGQFTCESCSNLINYDPLIF